MYLMLIYFRNLLSYVSLLLTGFVSIFYKMISQIANKTGIQSCNIMVVYLSYGRSYKTSRLLSHVHALRLLLSRRKNRKLEFISSCLDLTLLGSAQSVLISSMKIISLILTLFTHESYGLNRPFLLLVQPSGNRFLCLLQML